MNQAALWGRLRRAVAVLVAGAAVMMPAPVAWPADPPREVDLPLTVRWGRPPRGLALASAPEVHARVRVRGPRQQLSNLAASPPPVCEPSLDGLSAGVHTLNIKERCIRLPAGVTVVAIVPGRFVFRLEKEVYKRVPVVVSLEGRPAPGFTVDDARPEPTAVALQGARSLLDPLTRVFTRPVDVTGAAASFARETRLDLPAGIAPLVPEGRVVAHVTLARRVVTRVFERVTIGVRGTRMRWTVSPKTATLQIRGPENLLETLRGDLPSRVYLDLSGVKAGVYVRRAVIDLPPEVELLSAAPGLFTVTLRAR